MRAPKPITMTSSLKSPTFTLTLAFTLSFFLALTLTPIMTEDEDENETGNEDDDDDGDEDEDDQAKEGGAVKESECLPSKTCSQGFSVTFEGKALSCNEKLSPNLAKDPPDLSLGHSNGGGDGDQDKLLVLMVDPDAPSARDCPQSYWLHWMTLATLEKEKIVPNNDSIIEYKGPSPPEGSGAHRYQVLVFPMEEQENSPELDKKRPRNNFRLQGFLDALSLQSALASFQFKAEN